MTEEDALLFVISALFPAYDTAEIADILNIPESEIYNRLDRARARKARAA